MWRVDEPGASYFNHFAGDKYLIASESHRFYGLSRKLHGSLTLSRCCALATNNCADPIDVNAGKQFVIQYEFRPLANWDCSGGARDPLVCVCVRGCRV